MTPVLVLSASVWFASHSGWSLEPTRQTSTSVNDWSFLSQAEDVEREAWWIVTDRRVDGATSPFRILRAASSLTQSKGKSQAGGVSAGYKGPSVKFCKKLQVILEDSQAHQSTWRVESLCQKPASEIGRLRLLQRIPPRWEVTIRPPAFEDHFGLSTGILFRQFSCEMDLDQKGKLIKMSCPGYVRDRAVGEIVQFKTFEYLAQGSPLLKIEGDVKKDLQVIATFKSDVPLAGDIVLKVKKIPQQKSVEEKAEFSDSQNPIRGGSNGEKESDEKNQSKDSKSQQEIGENQKAVEESQRQQGREEGGNQENRNQEGSSAESEKAVPPIEEPPVPPSR